MPFIMRCFQCLIRVYLHFNAAHRHTANDVFLFFSLFHRLHENEMRFKPQLSAFEFQRLLYNLTAVRISNAGGQNCKCVCVLLLKYATQLAWDLLQLLF